MREESAPGSTDDENIVIQKLADYGAKLIGKDSSSLTFEHLLPRGFITRRILTEVPRSAIPDLIRQLEHKALENSSLVGFAIPNTGYVEVTVNTGTGPQDTAAASIFRREGDDIECVHKDIARMLPSMAYRASLSLDKDRGAMRGMISPRLHVSKSAEGPCIEISNASPLAMFLYEGSFIRSSRPFLTIKIDHGTALEEDAIFAKSDPLIRSFIYELDVRNGVVLGLENRQQPTDHGAALRHVWQAAHKVRYPETPIQYEAAELFNFGSRAQRDNPLLAFLSYYQVLEYFLPAAASNNIVEKVRRELRQTSFDREDDRSLRSLVHAVERHAKLPESEHLRTLVREYVRFDRLKEFFNADWGRYFTPKGPILKVQSLDLNGSPRDLANHVADRVYQIRNRIVHAKDDPRFEEARVLLPHSREAHALRPDVELVRLLAVEAIIVGQDRNFSSAIAD
jgi:hypothetical protein